MFYLKLLIKTYQVISNIHQSLQRKIERRRLSRSNTYLYKLGVMGIMKNESINIIEWVEHYLWQGADQIYLIDNGSTDDTIQKVAPYIKAKKVKMIEFPEQHKQLDHYCNALQKFDICEHCEWLLVADIDEFWFCKDGLALSDALIGYRTIDVIYANWTNFGSNGYIKHPPSIRKAFTKKQDALDSYLYTKWICKTKILHRKKNLGIHRVFGACSSKTFTLNERFQLNHYRIQSLDYFTKIKMTRGDSYYSVNVRDLNYFKEHDEICTVEDFTLSSRLQ